MNIKGVIIKGMSFLILLIILFSIIFTVSIVSAGPFDWIKKTVTGRASTEPTNVSVTVVGVGKVNITVHNSSLTGVSVDSTEKGVNNITFTATVSDPDGITDINDSSVLAKFHRVGEPLRENTTACSKVS